MTHQEIIPGGIKILMVDDDKKLCRLVGDYLGPMGYAVEATHDGVRGLEMMLAGNYEAVILDVMMPGMDGFEVLKRLRKKSDIPVLMLTAMGDETDRIVGLEMGADDYLPKTFSSRELLARLRAVTRRHSRSHHQTSTDGETLIFGDLQIDPGARTARLGEKTLNLTPVEYDLLALLAKAPGRVLTRALANLVRNAVKYAADNGPIYVLAERKKDTVSIEVRDTGPGVSEDLLDQLFEPFFRPEPSRDRDSGGVGLGLAIVKTCVETCRGKVTARNLKPRGFAVTIILKT